MTRVLPDRIGLRLGSIGFSFVLAAAALACTDDGNDEAGDETTGGDGDGDASGDGDGDASGDGDGDTGAVSYAADIQPIWDASCLTACHMPGGSAAAILDLSGDSYAKVVNVTSGQAASLLLVEPGNATDSYLVAKLRGTQAAVGGLGANMPSGTPPLSEATIVMIEDWINAGAAP